MGVKPTRPVHYAQLQFRPSGPFSADGACPASPSSTSSPLVGSGTEAYCMTAPDEARALSLNSAPPSAIVSGSLAVTRKPIVESLS